MKLRLWRGYHSEALLSALRENWSQAISGDGAPAELLIACPPALDGAAPEHFDFLGHLPFDEIEWLGDWSALNKNYVPQPYRFKNNAAKLPPVILGVFTSGTVSGAPRLVLYTRKNIESSLKAIHALFDRSRIDTLFCYAQPFHTFGLLLGYMYSIIYKLKLITPDGRYDRSSHEKRVAIATPKLMTLGTPTHFYDLLNYVKAEAVAIAPSYTSNAGGASVSRTLWLRLRDELHIDAPSIGYGCTEASPGITHLPPGHEPQEDHEIGFPLPSLQATITANGVTISGESVCAAIIDRNGVQTPREILIRDRLRARQDGVWIYDGRIDLQLNRGGEKFSLENIEASLLQSLGLHAVAVAVRDERLGEDLALFMQNSGDLEPNDILTAVADILLIKHRLRLNPTNVRWVPQLPMNPSFKIDRKTASELFQR